MTVACWRHGNVDVQLEPGDGVWLILNLSTGPRVARMTCGTWSHRQTQLGSITVTDPEDATRFQIWGAVDVFQMHLAWAKLSKTLTPSQLAAVRTRFIEVDRELECCAYRALVALYDGDGSDVLLLSSIAWQISRALVGQRPVKGRRAAAGLSTGRSRS